MDQKTKEAYNKNAKSIKELHKDLKPERLYQLVNTFFIKNESTLDLGCGIGRDTSWLNNNDFPTVGCDFSSELLKLAREDYPDIIFFEDSLPFLKEVLDATFYNVFCSAVIQHIPKNKISETIRNIIRILKPDGHIIISFRNTNNMDRREEDKLYENYEFSELKRIVEKLGGKIVFQEAVFEESRELIWKNLVIKKG